MVKHTQIIRQLLLTNCLSVIYHFLWLALVVGADFDFDFTFSVWFVYGIQWTEAMVCRYYAKQVLLKISQSSLKNNCLGAFFSNQVADWRPATLFKRRLRHIGFPVNFAKLEHPFYWTLVAYASEWIHNLNWMFSRRSQAIEVQEVLYLCRIHLGHVPREQQSLALKQLT